MPENNMKHREPMTDDDDECYCTHDADCQRCTQLYKKGDEWLEYNDSKMIALMLEDKESTKQEIHRLREIINCSDYLSLIDQQYGEICYLREDNEHWKEIAGRSQKSLEVQAEIDSDNTKLREVVEAWKGAYTAYLDLDRTEDHMFERPFDMSRDRDLDEAEK